jgi:hypothetical protein
MSAYKKALVAVFGAVLMALYSALGGDNHIGPEEAINIGIAAFAALQVYITANLPTLGVWRYAKTVTAVALAVLNLLVSEWTGGIDSSEAVNLVIAAAVALGVFAVPNTVPVIADPPVV